MKRVALISIIVSDKGEIAKLNEYLSEASEYVIGRMGIPYKARNISIISVAIDAPQDFISALSGKIGKLKGVASRTTYSDVLTPEDADGEGKNA